MDDTSKKVSAWWDSLTTKAKKAILRRSERRSQKKAAREALRGVSVSGYVCPRCWSRSPTPEARRECRASHRRAA